MSQTVLTGEAVDSLMKDCLFASEAESNACLDRIKVEGIMMSCYFDPAKIEKNYDQINLMVQELSAEFSSDTDHGGGGGWSFLNLCNDRHGDLWTGLQSTMDVFCMLAMGAGLCKWLLPRDMWNILLGGMPYVAFNFTPVLN